VTGLNAATNTAWCVWIVATAAVLHHLFPYAVTRRLAAVLAEIWPFLPVVILAHVSDTDSAVIRAIGAGLMAVSWVGLRPPDDRWRRRQRRAAAAVRRIAFSGEPFGIPDTTIVVAFGENEAAIAARLGIPVERVS